MLLFIITFICCVYVCVQNICFCGFCSADFYLSFMNNFAIVICSCFSFIIHSMSVCVVYLLRPTLAGCALLLLAILFLMSFTLITINYPRVGFGCKKGAPFIPHISTFTRVYCFYYWFALICHLLGMFIVLSAFRYICICSLCCTFPLSSAIIPL